MSIAKQCLCKCLLFLQMSYPDNCQVTGALFILACRYGHVCLHLITKLIVSFRKTDELHQLPGPRRKRKTSASLVVDCFMALVCWRLVVSKCFQLATGKTFSLLPTCATQWRPMSSCIQHCTEPVSNVNRPLCSVYLLGR